MTIYKDIVEADVRIGEGVVTIKRKGSSELVQAKIVATQPGDAETRARLWLDRLIHSAHETNIGGYPVTGAFVSEIEL